MATTARPAAEVSVIDLLRARVARGSTAPHRDGASIALVVEGGAMRGVISAGMVTALEDLGLASAFDAVYGSSAGAINAAYFLAGQARLGTSIYYEDINSRQFIDLARAFTSRPILDLDFLLDDVAVTRKVLDVARVVGARSPLAVLATDVDRRDAAVLRDFADGTALRQALRAGATMPIVAGGPYALDGRRYLDAVLSEPIPVRAAEHDGHTHVLALLTRSGVMRARPSAFDRYFVGPRLRRLSPELAARYLDRAAPYSQMVRAIEAGLGPAGRARVLGVRVPDLHIRRLERRAEVLKSGALQGFNAVMDLFDGPDL
jgi:predicted patatin/cPLA2 family phospholipase